MLMLFVDLQEPKTVTIVCRADMENGILFLGMAASQFDCTFDFLLWYHFRQKQLFL